jgi:hypothetical protein
VARALAWAQPVLGSRSLLNRSSLWRWRAPCHRRRAKRVDVPSREPGSHQVLPVPFSLHFFDYMLQ